MNKRSGLNMLRTVPLLSPAAISAARTGDYMGLQHYKGVILTMIGLVGRSAAQDDTTLTVRQAQAAAGTGSKTLTPRNAYVREGATLAAAAAATPVLHEKPESIVTNGDMVSIVDIEIDAAELDVENDFTHVTLRTGAVGSGTRVVEFNGIACDPHYATDPRYLQNPLA